MAKSNVKMTCLHLMSLCIWVTALGMGIYIRTNSHFNRINPLFPDRDLLAGSIWLIATGAGAIVLGFILLCCIIHRYTRVEGAVSLFLAIFAMVGLIVGGGTALHQLLDLSGDLSVQLESTLKYYNTMEGVSSSWDYVQISLDCCGQNGFSDYSKYNITLPDQLDCRGQNGFSDYSKYNITLPDQTKVPDTCCINLNHNPDYPVYKNETGCQTEAQEIPSGDYKYLNTKGCEDDLKKEFTNEMIHMIGSGLGLALVQVIMWVTGVCIFCKCCRN